MLDPESMDNIPASEAELGELRMHAITWLEENAQTRINIDTEIVDAQDGVPIIRGHDMPHLEFQASLEAVRAVIPEVVPALRLEGPLTVSFYTAHYEETDDGLEYREPVVVFGIEGSSQGEDGRSESLSLEIEQDEETGELFSKRVYDPQFPPGMHPAEAELMDPRYAFEVATSRNPAGGAVGTIYMDQMTTGEYSTLMEVVDNLDAIKAFDERAAAADV